MTKPIELIDDPDKWCGEGGHPVYIKGMGTSCCVCWREAGHTGDHICTCRKKWKNMKKKTHFTFEEMEDVALYERVTHGIRVNRDTTIKCPSCETHYPVMQFLDGGTMEIPWKCPNCDNETTNISLWNG